MVAFTRVLFVLVLLAFKPFIPFLANYIVRVFLRKTGFKDLEGILVDFKLLRIRSLQLLLAGFIAVWSLFAPPSHRPILKKSVRWRPPALRSLSTMALWPKLWWPSAALRPNHCPLCLTKTNLVANCKTLAFSFQYHSMPFAPEDTLRYNMRHSCNSKTSFWKVNKLEKGAAGSRFYVMDSWAPQS